MANATPYGYRERPSPTEGERHMLPCGKPPSGRLQAGKPVQRSGSPPAALTH
ncbi:hypothetical protein HW132_23950 [Brasilonema sp. CT11]|nr:hypothetical protein [Brasilonema sp. CT11]